MPVFEQARTQPYRALSLGIFAVAVYLCLVNLDYAALWHDEAPAAMIGYNLLQQGDITGWDGRNLVGGTNGRTLNEDFRDVLPPLMYAFNAVGFAAFGFNETGARIMPALIGLLSLGLFFLLVRQQLAGHPRLIFFIFLFAAWSPQLLLFFRQSRYYAFMAFALIAGFYLYERYWRTKKAVWLAALTLIAVLSFFNHYAAGAATMLSFAAWHLIFHARETTRQEWLAFTLCGLLVTALGAAWLVYMGLIGGERSGLGAFSGITAIEEYQGTVPLLALRLWIYMRELFTADWISWPVFLWFSGMLLLIWRWRRDKARSDRVSGQIRRREQGKNGDGSESRRKEPGAGLPVAAVGKIVLMGLLFALFSAMLSEQPVWAFPLADLRYYMGALPLLLAMKGLFAEWVWRKSRIAGLAVISALLFTSIGAAPFNVVLAFTGERTLGAHLFQFVREIHRPYPDSIRAASDYLLEHAGQDDLVYVPSFNDREALMFNIGHHVRFCCLLDRSSPLPRAKTEALDAPLHVEGNTPEWFVVFGEKGEAFLKKFERYYALAERLDVYWYPTQRPEIHFHAFVPLPARHGVFILRLKDQS